MSKETPSDENQEQEPNRRPPLNHPKPLPPRKAPVPHPETAFPFQVPSQRPETNDQNGRPSNPVYQQPPETQQREQYQGPYNPPSQDYYGQQNQQVPFSQIPQYNQQPQQQQGYNPQQQNKPKSNKKLAIIIAAVLGFMLIVLGITLVTAFVGSSSAPRNSSPVVNDGTMDNTTYIYREGNDPVFSLPASSGWTKDTNGYTDSSGKCTVAFNSVSGRSRVFENMPSGLSDMEKKQKYFEEENIVPFVDAEYLAANQFNYDVVVNGEIITFYSAPMTFSDIDFDAWSGGASWPAEGTAISFAMACDATVSLETTKTKWEHALDNVTMREK